MLLTVGLTGTEAETHIEKRERQNLTHSLYNSPDITHHHHHYQYHHHPHYLHFYTQFNHL